MMNWFSEGFSWLFGAWVALCILLLGLLAVALWAPGRKVQPRKKAQPQKPRLTPEVQAAMDRMQRPKRLPATHMTEDELRAVFPNVTPIAAPAPRPLVQPMANRHAPMPSGLRVYGGARGGGKQMRTDDERREYIQPAPSPYNDFSLMDTTYAASAPSYDASPAPAPVADCPAPSPSYDASPPPPADSGCSGSSFDSGSTGGGW